MTFVELTEFICEDCRIRVFVNGAADSKNCPYCRRPFEKKKIRRQSAEEYPLPSLEDAQRKMQSLYKCPPTALAWTFLIVSVILLIIAIGMQCNSVDDYIFQPLIITVYSLIMLAFMSSRFIIYAFYKAPEENSHSPTVSVLVPCMNEELVIRQTIERIFGASYSNEKLEVLCVNDGSSDNTLEKMLDALTRHPNLVIIDFIENKGLCHGWAVSSLMANGEIMVCVDSDTFIFPGSLDKLVQGFADPRVGGISGHCDIENAQTNLLTKMQDTRYFFSYKIMKAAESVTGTVSCLPGCFSAYRKVCVLRVLDEWINAKVMGTGGNFADDRSLTNLILRDYRIIYDDRALATTIAPEKWGIYLRQQARWNRSYLREVLKASKWMWKKHPTPALAWFTMMWMPLVEPVILVLALAVIPCLSIALNGKIDPPWSYLLGIAAITGVWTLHYLAKTGRKGWWTGFVYTISYMFLFCWQVYWAFLTLKTKKWGTRTAGNPQESDKKESKSKIPATMLVDLDSSQREIKDGWISPVATSGIKYAKTWFIFLIVAIIGINFSVPLIIDYGKTVHKTFFKKLKERTCKTLNFKNSSSFKQGQKKSFGLGPFGSKIQPGKKHCKFTLGMGLVQLPIVHHNTPGDVRLFFEKCDKFEAKGSKKVALALAQAYLTLLYFSKIEETPTRNAEEQKALDELIAALGPNAWLATVIQESMFSLHEQSGYFQLDFTPVETPGNEWIDNDRGFWKYCAFLKNVSREIAINGDPEKKGKALSDPDYRPDLTAFCCSAILKGYFDSGTWMALTKNAHFKGIHNKIMKLALNYSMNPANRRTVTIKIPGQDPHTYTYPASQILVRIFAWCFNRGRFTDSLIWKKPEWEFHVKPFFNKYYDGQTALEDLIRYVPYKKEQHDWKYPWGARYIYQIPAIANELDKYAKKGASSRYSAKISLQDMKDYLAVLKPLYPKKALNAGIRKAEKEFGKQSFAYDSEKFFNVFSAIVKAVIEASTQKKL